MEDVVGSGVDEDVVDGSGGGVELDVVMGTEDDYRVEMSANIPVNAFTPNSNSGTKLAVKTLQAMRIRTLATSRLHSSGLLLQ